MITLQFNKLVLVFFVLCLSLTNTSTASDLTHKFGNPAFSKDGYSQHALSIEQLQYTRENDRAKDIKSAVSQAERDEKNKTINKFIANVESRIYANLSKQLVDNMFGTSCTSNCATSGTATVEGSQIYWVKDASTDIISLTITDATGTVSTLSVPVGDFTF
jgi:hypothetical protein|tara:strand:- start:1301 stop:1783 length:483 start_codon:yes stop_codon:yes gene_type:complete